MDCTTIMLMFSGVADPRTATGASVSILRMVAICDIVLGILSMTGGCLGCGGRQLKVSELRMRERILMSLARVCRSGSAIFTTWGWMLVN